MSRPSIYPLVFVGACASTVVTQEPDLARPQAAVASETPAVENRSSAWAAPPQRGPADSGGAQEASVPVRPLGGLADFATSDEIEAILAVQGAVQSSAGRFELDPALINGLIWVESRFRNKSKGPAGAMGLMQLMPRTSRAIAKKLGRSNRPYDPEFNIEAGSYYLARMMKRFDGDESLALAAYNRGAGTVANWQAEGKKMPERTRAFVTRVKRARDDFARVVWPDSSPGSE